MESLVPYQSMNLADTMELAKAMAASGFFTDSRQAAQAVVKILAGRELGFGPVASMTGINVIKGKITLSANLIAASVKRSGRYNYRVARMDDTACSIDFYEGNQKIGNSTFTAADAKTAGLSGDNWRKFPRNMLFARAMSNGAKWYCPDLSGGPLYTPDELGANVDGETGEIVTEPEPPKPAKRQWLARPWLPETLIDYMNSRVPELGNGDKPAQNRHKYAMSALGAVTNGNAEHQHAIIRRLFNQASRGDLSAGECEAIIAWIGATAENEWQPSSLAVQEAAAFLEQPALVGNDRDPDTDAAMA